MNSRFSQAIGSFSCMHPFSEVAVPTCKLLTLAPLLLRQFDCDILLPGLGRRLRSGCNRANCSGKDRGLKWG